MEHMHRWLTDRYLAARLEAAELRVQIRLLEGRLERAEALRGGLERKLEAAKRRRRVK